MQVSKNTLIAIRDKLDLVGRITKTDARQILKATEQAQATGLQLSEKDQIVVGLLKEFVA